MKSRVFVYNLQLDDHRRMKARVYVTLKPGVLDPQGKAIHHSTELLGFRNLADIRQGKFFEISFRDGVTSEEAAEAAQRLGKDILANPVIEDYRVEVAE